MSPRLPLTESRIAIFGGLMLLAMVIRVVCSFLIGAGTFGPDGTGAEAAVQLGGHPNPILPLLIGFFGGGRGLSVFSGAVTAVACAKLGQRLGGNPWTCGLMGACAPLLVLPASDGRRGRPSDRLCSVWRCPRLVAEALCRRIDCRPVPGSQSHCAPNSAPPAAVLALVGAKTSRRRPAPGRIARSPAALLQRTQPPPFSSSTQRHPGKLVVGL